MNIDPDTLAALKSLLSASDAAVARLCEHTALIAPAQAALARLRDQLSDMDRQAADLARQHLPADQERISRLIAGADVPQPDRKAIEARALQEGVLAAHRRQLSEDSAALQAHVDGLTTTAAALRQAAAEAERAFLIALADAVRDTYKWNAIQFVNANIPALHSVCVLMRSRIGEFPAWANRVLPGIKIEWREEEQIPNPLKPGAGANYMIHKPLAVWPRPDSMLLSGEPTDTDAAATALIDAIRACDGAESPLAPAD